MIALTSIGIILNGYSKNIAQFTAVDAARYAALADETPGQAESRAEAALMAQLSALYRPHVKVERMTAGSQCSMVASVTLAPVAFGFVRLTAEIKEVSSAVCEVQ